MPSRVRSHTLPTGELAVLCHCQRSVIYVRPEVIADCRTESCGREGCVEG